jgi:hypothetical protein
MSERYLVTVQTVIGHEQPSDEDTVERIHEQVPGAPVLSKPVFRHTLAGAVAAVTKH